MKTTLLKTFFGSIFALLDACQNIRHQLKAPKNQTSAFLYNEHFLNLWFTAFLIRFTAFPRLQVRFAVFLFLKAIEERKKKA